MVVMVDHSWQVVAIAGRHGGELLPTTCGGFSGIRSRRALKQLGRCRTQKVTGSQLWANLNRQVDKIKHNLDNLIM